MARRVQEAREAISRPAGAALVGSRTMSLRFRLVLLLLALVALVTVALSALELRALVNTLSSQAAARGEVTTGQVSGFLLDRLQSETEPLPQSLEQTKEAWNSIVAYDPAVKDYLKRVFENEPSLLEISVAGEDGEVLVSSNPATTGLPMRRREPFSAWNQSPWYRRVWDLVRGNSSLEVTKTIGIKEQTQPMFTVQVIASSVLVADPLRPEFANLAEVSGGAILVSLLLIVLGSNLVLKPVRQIEQTIDRIAQGKLPGDAPGSGAAKEFQAVQSKLAMLGQQYLGAQADSVELRQNIGLLLERMASQLDVATRLAAISRLTSGVAHEIKNPLNAILLRLDLLRARLGEPEEELTKEIDILSREVLRLDRVVKTFLDFSRPLEVRFEELDLAALTREVAELITPQARLGKIEVLFSAPQESTGMRGDPDLLKQAVLNLVSNAMEAMPGGGKLWINVSREGEKLALEVADNGPGIPLELRQKVFQLYFTTKPGGSGIGLAMTFRAVQLHNGTISFTSEGGVGTSFRLEFPATVRHA
jgi:signal transduction histidine kinase